MIELVRRRRRVILVVEPHRDDRVLVDRGDVIRLSREHDAVDYAFLPLVLVRLAGAKRLDFLLDVEAAVHGADAVKHGVLERGALYCLAEILVYLLVVEDNHAKLAVVAFPIGIVDDVHRNDRLVLAAEILVLAIRVLVLPVGFLERDKILVCKRAYLACVVSVPVDMDVRRNRTYDLGVDLVEALVGVFRPVLVYEPLDKRIVPIGHASGRRSEREQPDPVIGLFVRTRLERHYEALLLTAVRLAVFRQR